jgi:hypothetical protein
MPGSHYAMALPATQNAYPYVLNKPLSFTDPSGEITPLLLAGLAANAGALVGGGLSVANQCIGSSDIKTCLKCLDWGEVGVAASAGAVAGLVRFGVGLAFAASSTGLLSTMIGGFFAGLFSGQAFRATELALTGRLDQAGSVLFQPQDLYLDGFLGAAGSAVGWGVKNVFTLSINRNLLKQLPNRSASDIKTTGLLLATGKETLLRSGWEGPASLIDPGTPGFDIITRTHVEGHAAALMIINNWSKGVLYINNRPCI